MLNTQTDIGSFNQRIIQDLIKVNPLSQEQAKELLGREQNGPGRKHVLQLLSVQVRKTAKMGEGNNVDTPVGKGPGGNLLDPEVSALCLIFFCLHIILDGPFSSAHTTAYVSIRTQPLFSRKYARQSRSKCACAHTDGYCEIHTKSY